MVTVKEAKQIIIDNVGLNEIVLLHLNPALNSYSAEDIFAPIDVPLFNQSAMDGYAFNFEEINQSLTIVDTIPAGDTRKLTVNKGEAVRIFTGSMVPDSCDTVVMQELTELENGKLLVKDAGLKLGGNIREKGHQIKKGELALKKGTKIKPATIGFLASLGINKVKVYRTPSVAVLATGSELVKPGKEVVEGQVYEANTFMLQAALNSIGIEPQVTLLQDDLEETKNAIKTALLNHDIVILSGGISVGDYDFVKESLEENEVNELFYKVKQKPGKPLYFGKKQNKIVFALPGNPGAALNCFYLYVLPAINIVTGHPKPFLEQTQLPIGQSFQKKTGRANFLKAYSDGKTVNLLDGQGSDVLLSFSQSDCLVYLPEERESVEANELVDVILLP
jgi:molybdopterin molybdotransferase